MIFDSHAHYDDEAFDPDREALLSGMNQAGISHIVNVGASLEGVQATVELTEAYPFLYGAVGVHPDHVGSLDEEKLAWMRSLCDRKKIVASGRNRPGLLLGQRIPRPAENLVCQTAAHGTGCQVFRLSPQQRSSKRHL